MMEALKWLAIAIIAIGIGKAIAKYIWPEDWPDEF